MANEDELWHLVEARREDGLSTMFRIRDLAPRLEQPRIFVVEVPYPVTELSRLPDATAYRRMNQFEEQWLAPACAQLGWTFVAAKTDDGSCFLYLYGSDDPAQMIAKLSPFDPELSFFDEHDPRWEEYAALRELIEEANALPQPRLDEAPAPPVDPDPPSVTHTAVTPAPAPPRRAPPRATASLLAAATDARAPAATPARPPRAKAKPKAKPKPKPKAKPKAKAKVKTKTKTKAKPRANPKPKARAKAKAARTRR